MDHVLVPSKPRRVVHFIQWAGRSPCFPVQAGLWQGWRAAPWGITGAGAGGPGLGWNGALGRVCGGPGRAGRDMSALRTVTILKVPACHHEIINRDRKDDPLPLPYNNQCPPLLSGLEEAQRIMEDLAVMLLGYLYFPSLGDPFLSHYISLMHLHNSVPAWICSSVCPTASFLPSGWTVWSITLTVQTRGSFVASKLKARLLTEKVFARLYPLVGVFFLSLLTSLFKKDFFICCFPRAA